MPHDQEGQEVEHGIIGTQDPLERAHITDPPAGANVNGSRTPNPWEDAAQAKELPLSPTTAQLDALDFTALDAVTARGLAPAHDVEEEKDEEGEKEREVKKEEILHEFDPLASHEEEAARAAWAASEAHPPPPPQETATGSASMQPGKSEPISASQPTTPARGPSPLPSFPSLAALARTFALPLTSGSSRKPRPRSLDSAAPVPSPATISSFAAQQSAPPLSAASSSSADAVVTDSGRNTPTGMGGKGKNGAEHFDFQRFLDQMKLKGAEPVAKYLRSYVGTVCLVCTRADSISPSLWHYLLSVVA